MSDAPNSSPFSRGIASYFLLALLLFSLYLGMKILYPFLNTVIITAVLAIMATPLYSRILKAFNGRTNLAAVVTVALVVVIIVIPAFFFAVGLSEQGVKSLREIQLWALRQDFDELLKQGGPYVDWIREKLPFLRIEDIDLQSKVLEYTSNFAQYMFEFGKNMLQDAFWLVIKFLLMVLLLFFFLRDGGLIIRRLRYLAPLRHHQEDVIIDSLQRVARSVLLGSLFVAALQGFVAGLGFIIVGIPGLFWGAMMAFAALVPVFGASLIWFPTVVYLFVVGDWEWALFLAIWCAGIVVNIDTILRPMLLRGAAKLSPFYIFVAILGAVSVFGFKGILYGPLILSFAMVMLDIYSEEYGEALADSGAKDCGETPPRA